jgi:hypothetical protein
MELSTLANLAEIIGAAIVVGGVAFAFVQLAHFRRQRQVLMGGVVLASWEKLSVWMAPSDRSRVARSSMSGSSGSAIK